MDNDDKDFLEDVSKWKIERFVDHLYFLDGKYRQVSFSESLQAWKRLIELAKGKL